jgi:hypothetical protein
MPKGKFQLADKLNLTAMSKGGLRVDFISAGLSDGCRMSAKHRWRNNRDIRFP